MHMEGNASKWLQVYKLKHGLGDWGQFTQAVRGKFGVDEYPQAMRDLVNVTQQQGVEESLKLLMILDMPLLCIILS